MKIFPILACVVCCFSLMSCSADDNNVVTPEVALYKDLTNKDDVFFNLKLAVNERELSQYKKLLDENFEFLFSARDIDVVQFRSLDRFQEIDANENIFDPQFSKPGVDPILALDVAITFDADNWTAIDPPAEKAAYQGEKWYTQIISYFSIFEAPPNTFTSQKTLQARFTIRQSELDGKTVWRIVEWEDDVQSALASDASLVGTEERSWGEVKEMYRLLDPVSYRDQTGQDDVLINLALAYNNRGSRGFNEFGSIIDHDFTFYFSPTDLDATESPMLNREQELNVAQNMFNPAFSKPGVDPITSIAVDLNYMPRNWEPITPPTGQSRFAGDMWHRKVIDYFTVFEAPPNTFTSQKTLQAAMVIRQVNVGEQAVWRLIEWYDDVGSAGSLVISQPVETATWGLVKELYKDI